MGFARQRSLLSRSWAAMEQHSAYVPGSWLAFQNLSTNALALDQQEAVREASDPSGVLPFTCEIMQRRGPSFAERGLQAWHQAEQPSSSVAPRHSWLEIRYPLASTTLLQERYAHQLSGGVRVERLLEDVDSFAADVARRHVRQPSTRMVTAAIKSVEWLQGVARQPVDQDLRLVGQVVWTGTSSMLVIVEAHTLAEKRSWQTLGSSQFWIIAVDAGTQRRVNVPPVVPATSADVEMHQSAAEARERQKQEHHNNAPHNSRAQAEPHVHEPLRSLAWAHLQDQNAHGTIYGGHTLLHGYSLAQAAAQLYAGSTTVLPQALLDASFMQPHHVGTLVQYTAQVTACSQGSMHVSVGSHEAWPHPIQADDSNKASVRHSQSWFVFALSNCKPE